MAMRPRSEPQATRRRPLATFRRCAAPRGLTLAELLIATTILLMIATAVGMLASAVHGANAFSQGYLVAGQHARVALSRIEQTLRRTYATEEFPGFLVVSEQVGNQQLPQTLVVWAPSGLPANPAGRPLVKELVLFSPNPARPSELLEIRDPTNATLAPPPGNTSAWRTLTETLRNSQATSRIVLTDRLRTAPLVGEWNDSLTAAELRGLVRFQRLMAPTEEALSQYRAGKRSWDDMDWPLDRYRATSGTRCVVCQIELQVTTSNMATAQATAIPFFGSFYFAYELLR
jgi:prepilin-type N-terminal cleavage/methylation domain-containing protein